MVVVDAVVSGVRSTVVVVAVVDAIEDETETSGVRTGVDAVNTPVSVGRFVESPFTNSSSVLTSLVVVGTEAPSIWVDCSELVGSFGTGTSGDEDSARITGT